MDARVEVVLVFMKHNLGKRLPLSELAELVNLSDSRFRHLFTAETGTSPRLYLRSLRLDHAKHLLEETWLSIDQIALKVGWQDRSHFERRFKHLYGLTPARYRTTQRFTVAVGESQGDSRSGYDLTGAATR